MILAFELYSNLLRELINKTCVNNFFCVFFMLSSIFLAVKGNSYIDFDYGSFKLKLLLSNLFLKY